MIKILIFKKHPDETVMFRRTIRAIVERLKLKCVIDTHMTAQSLYEKLEQNIYEYDIIVLEGESPETRQLAQFVRKTNSECALLLISKDESVIRRFMYYRPSLYISDINAPKEYFSYLQRIIASAAKEVGFLVARTKGSVLRIPFGMIEYIESRGHYAYIHTNESEKAYCMVAKLDDIMSQLPENMFIRCHQSNIVHLRQIAAVNKIERTFQTFSGKKVLISRRNMANAIEIYNDFLKSSK